MCCIKVIVPFDIKFSTMTNITSMSKSPDVHRAPTAKEDFDAHQCNMFRH